MATIVIDAGHGGSDPGAVAPDGTAEKRINWETAVAVRDRLRDLGHACDIAPHRPSGRTPLRERVSFARSRHSHYFVSIHANSGGGAG
jgi:N-acetylmuramoyl-L-alanine amidase